jgi:hypothetical protein
MRVRPGEELEVRVEARDALGNLARVQRGAPWSVEAALVWRGPLRGCASSSSSATHALADTVIPLSVEVNDDGEDGRGSGGGWVVRGRAPVAGGEFLLEVVAVVELAAAGKGKKPTRTHLPGSPLLVVVGGGEAALLEQQQEVEAPTDEARRWAERAAAADDGDDGGKEEEEEPPRTSTAAERAFVAANPLVPVVENLRDLHLVSRVQAMREDERERRRRR